MPEPENPLDQDLGQPEPQPRDDAGRFVKQDPEPEVHPDNLVQQARAWGISDDELSRVDTATLAQHLLRLNQSYLAGRGQQPQAPPAAAPPEEWGFGEYESNLDPAFAGPLKGHFKKLAQEAREAREEAKAAREQLQRELQTRDQREAQREVQRGTQVLDATFAKLAKMDDRYERIYGSEPMESLKANDPRREARIGACGAVAITPQNVSWATSVRLIKAFTDRYLPQDNQPTRQQAPSSPYAQTPKAQNGISREDWDRAGLARPSGRNGAAEPQLTGDRLATANLARRMHEAGLGGGQGSVAGDDAILDGFPE